MAKRKRVQRPKDELRRELAEQLDLLRHACDAYDKGLEAIGKHISLSLRVLLHHHGQSRALLDQLGLRGSRFFDSAGPLNPNNLLTEFPLVMMRFSTGGGRYIPCVAAGGGPRPLLPVPFVDWWNEPVLKDDRGHKFCRREIVLHVADTDGGAHVDGELDEAYIRLSRENSLGWQFTAGNVSEALRGRPELACMRQIAHEVLLSIHEFVPEFREHSRPVLPVSKGT